MDCLDAKTRRMDEGHKEQVRVLKGYEEEG